MSITRIRALGGAGVGYRPEFAEAFFGEEDPGVSWVEVITENFLPDNGHDTLYIQNLRRLREKFPVALHGVSLSLASAEPVNHLYLKQLAWLEREIEPWIVSDHLCWTGLNGENLFDLLPFPYSREALELVAGKVARVQDLLGRPLALENITYYAKPRGSEMTEADFLNALVKRTGCRLLLDVNNIYVNSVNLGINPLAYLSSLDLKSVAQVHLAGHTKTREGLLLDTHGAPVAEEVWALYEWLQARVGHVPAMIERDENIPDWLEMRPELERLAAIQAKGARREFARVAEPRP